MVSGDSPAVSGTVLARLMGRHLETRLGQSIVVENRTGAGGTVGADFVARALADGYTFLFTAQGPLVLNPFLMKRLPYNAEAAFAPVTVVAEAPNVLVTNQAFPVANFSELRGFAKANPDKMTFGTQGVGTTGHVTGELINQQTGINLTHVAYQGFPPALTDIRPGADAYPDYAKGGARGATVILRQDTQIQSSQGVIQPREHEHLATSDRGVIKLRRIIKECIDAVARGDDPRGVFRTPPPDGVIHVEVAETIVSEDEYRQLLEHESLDAARSERGATEKAA
jgi:hypothetical protein